MITEYGFAGDLFAIALCILCGSVLRSSYTIKHINLRLFYIALVIVVGSSVQSIAFHAMQSQPILTTWHTIMFFSFQNSVLIGLLVLLQVMQEYVMNLFLLPITKKRKVRSLTWPIVMIFAIYKFYSPLNEMDIYIDPTTKMVINHGLQDNIFIWVYAYLALIIVILLLINHKKLITSVYRCLMVNTFLAFIIVILSYVLNITSFICISFMLPILAVLFLFHYNAYDTNMGTLDLKAFKSYVNDLKKTPFIMLSLYMKKDVLDRSEMLAKNFTAYVQDTFAHSKYQLFRVSDTQLILIFTKDENADSATLTILEAKVKTGLSLLYRNWGIPYQLLYIESSPELNSDDYLGLSSFFLTKDSLNTCKVCSESDIKQFQTYKKIDKVLEEIQRTHNLNDERIIVQYQPIMQNNGVCKKAEALMRLRIDDKIYYPVDFLPVVQRENYQHLITQIVLNKVCQHIKKLAADGYLFDKISVNISTEDLLINEGYKDLIRIVEEDNAMSFDKIAFEILETSDTVKYDPLVKAMIAFKSITAVDFYLDDYGSGYSNFLRLLSLPVSVIKFDRSILQKIRQNNSVFSTVNTNVKTFSQAGYSILFEGIEDEQDIETCEKMQVDFYQGFKFAKPGDLSILYDFFERAEC